MSRNTIQRMLVLDSVKAMDNHPTADEIYDNVSVKCPTISKGTVYRNLNLLADEGIIRRVEIANAPDRYDHTVYTHGHFRCLKCGGVFDYTVAQSIEADETLNPDFDVTDIELVFNGYCKKCEEAQ